MKASEETIFPIADSFFKEHQRAPTGDELLALCGGGKKEVLAIKKKWEALNYLKSNGLDVPTRWLSLLGDYFKSTQEDIDAQRRQINEEANEKIAESKEDLERERQKLFASQSENDYLRTDLSSLKSLNDDLSKSIQAYEKQVGDLSVLKEQLNAEISEKTLQVRLQKDQINELKREHERALARLTASYETIINDRKVDIQQLNKRLTDYEEKIETLTGKLMVESAERERVKTELKAARQEIKSKEAQLSRLESENQSLVQGHQEELKVLNEKVRKLMSECSEMERQHSQDVEKIKQIPILEEQLQSMSNQLSEATSTERAGLEKQVEELSLMLKSISKQVNVKGQNNE